MATSVTVGKHVSSKFDNGRRRSGKKGRPLQGTLFYVS